MAIDLATAVLPAGKGAGDDAVSAANDVPDGTGGRRAIRHAGRRRLRLAGPSTLWLLRSHVRVGTAAVLSAACSEWCCRCRQLAISVGGGAVLLQSALLAAIATPISSSGCSVRNGIIHLVVCARFIVADRPAARVDRPPPGAPTSGSSTLHRSASGCHSRRCMRRCNMVRRQWPPHGDPISLPTREQSRQPDRAAELSILLEPGIWRR